MMCEGHSVYRGKGSKVNRMMDFQIIKNVIHSAKDFGLIEIIPTTMGEPLLYPKMKNLVEIVRANDLKINLTTNGTFSGMGARKWGKLLLPYTSDIKISINGATKATNGLIMKGIDHDKQLKDIEKIISIRDHLTNKGINDPTVTFQATFMESNISELPEILRLAIKMDADRFKGHHMWVTWPQLKNESLTKDQASKKRWNKCVQKLFQIAEEHPRHNGEKIRLDNVYSLPFEKSKSRLPGDWMCPFLGREAWIAWDGTFNVCCSPDAHRRTLGNFGNVLETDFIELWNNDHYRQLVDNWGDYPVCKKCNMRRPMEGAE